MHVALLGGAFNPPHIGHLMMARQVLDFGGVDEVWFLPNYGQHPPKPNVASVEDRVAMTRLIVFPKTQVSTLEIDNKLDGNTIHLLPLLPKEHTYEFIIGADWLPSFQIWNQWEELLKRIPFLVFPRAGYPLTPLYKNMRVLTHELLITTDISATKIRNRVKAGLTIDQFVHPTVAQYITEHRLYI